MRDTARSRSESSGTIFGEQAEKCQEEAVKCQCEKEMDYQFKRQAKILSVFGWTSYRRKYYVCTDCHVGQAPLDRRLGIAAGQVTAGLAELLALAGVR